MGEEQGSWTPAFGGELVVASNRLPVVLHRKEGGGWEVEAGAGGLVTAMAPVLKDQGGRWIGWPGTVDVGAEELRDPLARAAERVGYDLVAVPLSREERDNYYYGFANEVLWPLLHDLQTRYRFDPQYWDAYRKVNRKFAGIVAGHVSGDDFVWVQDYHLMGVAHALRREGVENRLGYFLHTPFPSIDILVKLPWRIEILRGLLSYDVVGFQSLRDRDNFLDCVRVIAPEVKVEGGGTVVHCDVVGRDVRVGAFPISIDFDEFATLAESREVTEIRQGIHENHRGRTLVLGVDRLDYTKGIPSQLRSFATALERYPMLQGNVSLVQVVVPSREHIPEYGRLKEEVERLVGEVNGRFARGGWVPVHYLYRSLDRPELVAHYRQASVALITPLKDGMNLVSKEFCAAHVDEDGVLLLSEFAGSAAQLQDGAILINPYDVAGTAEAIYQACTMAPAERQRRMRLLRETVRAQDIYWWLETFARAATTDSLEGFPELRAYVPQPTPGH